MAYAVRKPGARLLALEQTASDAGDRALPAGLGPLKVPTLSARSDPTSYAEISLVCVAGRNIVVLSHQVANGAMRGSSRQPVGWCDVYIARASAHYLQ